MALLLNIVFVILLVNGVQFSLGLVEGARGATWNMGNGLENPGKIIGELSGDIKNGVEGFAKKAENMAHGIERGAEKIGSEVIGDIEKGAEDIAKGIENEMDHGVIGNVVKGAEHVIEDIGEGIEKGAEGVIDGAKGAIDGIGGIVGKLTPHKKDHDKNNHNRSSEHGRDHEKDKHRQDHHHGKHSKDDSQERKHHKGDDSHERHHDDRHHRGDSHERHHDDKHHRGDSHERHHDDRHHKGDSHERHHDDKRGRKHHERHTGRGIDRRTGIGSRDGIKTPILDLLGMTKSICRVSYAAESVIEDLGELHIWADKQMAMVEHAAVNYIIDNIVLKAVDGARRYHHKIINFVIDTHIGMQRLVTNSMIEAYRVSKAPIRELFACY